MKDGFVIWKRTGALEVLDDGAVSESIQGVAVLISEKPKSTFSPDLHRAARRSPIFPLRATYCERVLVPEVTRAIQAGDIDRVFLAMTQENTWKHLTLLSGHPRAEFLMGDTATFLDALVRFSSASGIRVGISVNYGPNIFVLVRGEAMDQLLGWVTARREARHVFRLRSLSAVA